MANAGRSCSACCCLGPSSRDLAGEAKRSKLYWIAASPLAARNGIENFLYASSQRAGRPRGRRIFHEESPGSTELRCRVTPGGGISLRRTLFRDSATERIPPSFGLVRSKGCGKSAPRTRQRVRHGKPHRVQDRIGTPHEPCSGSASGLVAGGAGQPVS
jgi:hypothetical protein